MQYANSVDNLINLEPHYLTVGDPIGHQCLSCGKIQHMVICNECFDQRNTRKPKPHKEDLYGELLEMLEIVEEALKQSEAELAHLERKCAKYEAELYGGEQTRFDL